ncbi:CIA30 family protein [Streptomyces sp. CB02400]|uniref:CIA30 family protein n=1 Tax=Streptomyces sp. CB02400 TaxID=1703944 RepID=UPI001F28755F|nr:CIA30 family protein [Streptomyces sp. CB02400]
MADDPLKGGQEPEYVRRKVVVPPLAYVKKALTAADDFLALEIVMTVGCGLRNGEARAVNVNNVVADDVYRVHEQIHSNTHEPAKLRHRKAGEFREVPLPGSVREAMERFEEKHGTTQDGYLLRGPSGYHTGTWDIGAENLADTLARLRVRAVLPGHDTLAVDHRLILGEKQALAPGVVDDFEGHVDDTALRFGYDFALQSYTGVGRRIDGDWSDFDALSLWPKADGSQHKLVLRLVAGGVAYEAYPSMPGTEGGTVTIPFADFRPAPWDTADAERRITAEDLADLSQFNIYINQDSAGTATAGAFHLDDLQAV